MPTDAASLVLAIDSTQVKTGVAELDKLTNAGARAEAATSKLGRSSTSAGVAAAKMAADAQMASRAAAGMALGVTSVGKASGLAAYQAQNLAFQINDVVTGIASGQAPMRVFAQQGGQFFQIMQQSGLGARGFATELLRMIGVLKVTRDAELAEEAANAAGAAQAVRGAAQRAAGNIVAADTEVALAAAAVRTAATSDALVIAQTRLAASHEAVAAAAAEATVAENALTAAEARAGEAAAASAAATVVALGPIVGLLAGVGVAVGLLVGGFKTFQAQVRNTGELDRYANSLGLTKKEMKELRQEVGGLSSKEMQDLDNRLRAFGITWGDVFNGLGKTASDALDISPAWQSFKAGVADAFKSAFLFAESAAAHMYGAWVGGYRTIVQTFGGLGPAIGHAFAAAANAAITAIEGLVNKSIDAVNSFAKGVNGILGKDVLGTFAHVDLGRVSDNYGKAGKAAGKSFGQNVADATAEAQAQIAANVDTIWNNIIGAAEKRIKTAADAILEDRTPKKGKKGRKQSDHGLADALAELDAQIRGQWRLAAAYQVSDAAVIKAEALQKAEEQAIRHKGEVGIFYEKELALAVAQRAADGAKTIADLRFETDLRKRVNDAVAAGTVTAAEANQQLQLEQELRPLVAAAAVAEGKAKQDILDIIAKLTRGQADLNTEIAREQYLRDLAANDNDLDKLKLEARLIGASNRERAVAIAQLEAIQKLKDMPGLSPAEQQNFIQSYINKANAAIRSPLQDWAATIPQTAGAVIEQLQSIEVRGFDGLANAITDVVTGTKSLKSAFKDLAHSIIADIIQMTVKMLIFRAVSSIMGGFGGGTIPGGPSSIQTGGGTNAFFAANPFGGMRARGGPVSPGQSYVVGERQPELFVPRVPGAIVPQVPRSRSAANDAAPQEIIVHVSASEEFDVKVERVAGRTVAAAAPTIVRAAHGATMRALTRPKLMGR